MGGKGRRNGLSRLNFQVVGAVACTVINTPELLGNVKPVTLRHFADFENVVVMRLPRVVCRIILYRIGE